MKTSELTGAALDWAVAKVTKCEDLHITPQNLVIFFRYGEPENWEPSTNWAQGGPIMEREGIGATVVSPSGDEMWLGANYKGRFVEYGATCLVACMRTYVASKLGDEVEIPAELMDK